MPFSNCFSQNFSFLPYSACWASISCQFKLFSVKTKGCLSAASGKHGSKLTLEHIAVFLIEFVHTTGSVDDFLSTGVERVAQRANLNVEAVFFHCGFGHEFVAARAGNVDFVVVRVNTLFHLISFRLSGHRGFACTSVKRGIFAIFGCFVKRIFCSRAVSQQTRTV